MTRAPLPHFSLVPLPGVGGCARLQSSSHAFSCCVLCLLLAFVCNSAAASSTRSMPLLRVRNVTRGAAHAPRTAQRYCIAHLFSRADKLTVVIPPSCKTHHAPICFLSLLTTGKIRRSHLRNTLVQLLQEVAKHWAALGGGDAVGLVDRKHYRLSLVNCNLHQCKVLLSNNALKAGALHSTMRLHHDRNAAKHGTGIP
jgi:hypothetical protein